MTNNLVYHYTSFEKLLSIFNGKTLRASDARYMNDTSEIHHGLALAKEYANKQCPGLMPEERTRAFVSCFSGDGNLLSQWRAYCPTGGVSLGFCRDALTKIAEKNRFTLEQCVYLEDEKERLLRALDTQLNRWKTHPPQSGSSASAARKALWNQAFQIACRMKHGSFSEEAEWRLLSIGDFSFGPKVSVSSFSAGLRPYAEIDICIDKRPHPYGVDYGDLWDIGIRKIVVGPHPQQDEVIEAVGDAIRSHSISNLSDLNWNHGPSNHGISVVYCNVPFRRV